MGLKDLAEQWLIQKRAENAARDARIRTEEAMIELAGVKTEGATKHDADGYTVTITGKLTRTLDEDAWHAIVDQVPEELRPVRYKPALDLRGLRYLEQHEPVVYGIVSRAITTKPAKAGVEVKISG